MKKFFECLRLIINFKNKKINLLTKEQQKSYENSEICYIGEWKFENKYVKHKKYCKVRDHCHYTRKCRGVAHSKCNLKFGVPKKIIIDFHNGSNYELVEELEKLITCLVGNTGDT